MSADHTTLTVTAEARGTATITVTAADGYGGSVSDSFTVTVKAAPVVASAISDVSGPGGGSHAGRVPVGRVQRRRRRQPDRHGVVLGQGQGRRLGSADQSALTVSGVAEGTATITVTAQDTDGNRVSDAFDGRQP